MNRESVIFLWGDIRKRLIITTAAVFITAAACFIFIDQIRLLLMLPAEGLEMSMVYLTPPEALMANLKLSFTAAALLMLPLILYQLVALIMVISGRGPRSALMLTLSMYLLFMLGLSFNYFLVFPMALNFFIGFSAPDLIAEFSVARYVSFAITFMLSFGLVFQLPVIFWFLGSIGLISTSFLRRNRKYALLLFVIFGALLTPPDIFSQVMMAAPLVVLYELGILVVHLVQRKQLHREAEQTFAE